MINRLTAIYSARDGGCPTFPLLVFFCNLLQELYDFRGEGGKCISKCVLQYDMGSDLVMNMVCHPQHDIIAAGMGHSTQLFLIHRQGTRLRLSSLLF